MQFDSKLKNVQAHLSRMGIDGWLLYDSHHSNSLAYTFLEIPKDKMTTRRFFYWIPEKGDPIKIVPMVEPYTLDHLPGQKWLYKSWKDLERLVFVIAIENRKIAMEYSPYNALPSVSKVDGGTIELIRKNGAEVVSSADILQHYTSVWNEKQKKSHFSAAEALEQIVDRTWAYIELCLNKQIPLDEYKVQQYMLQAMHEADCWTGDPPICAVNEHTSDPHYLPLPNACFTIRKGDFILLDLWCKQKGPNAVYADITRVGMAAKEVPAKKKAIFELVKAARDKATLFVKEKYENKIMLQGWEVDQACRNVIEEAGYGEYFIHRTGHNIGEEVHGPGANLDNFETHDYRQLLAGTCFSVEPGIYFPKEFGIRLEYDIYLDPNGKMHITGGIQEEIVRLQV